MIVELTMKNIVIAILISIGVLIAIGVLILTIIPDDDNVCPTIREIEMNPFMKIPPECQEMK